MLSLSWNSGLKVYFQNGFTALGGHPAIATWRGSTGGSIKSCGQRCQKIRTTGLEPIHHEGETKKCQVSFACRFKALKNINAFKSYSNVKC